MKTVLIGTPTITRPNAFGKIIRETSKTIELEITKMDFTAKTSIKGITHKFDKGSREWFSTQIGRTIKFWKQTGREIAGDSFIPNHNIIFDNH